MMTLYGWKATFYGFIELDAIRDSSQSFSDSVGNTPLLRTDGSQPAEQDPTVDSSVGPTYASTHPRVMFTPRNTTFGFKVEPPDVGSLKTMGVVEFDFFGDQPGNPLASTGPGATPTSTTESNYFSSAAPRMRHAYVEMKNPIVDVMAGQGYNLFGWQPIFFPATDSFLGIPNMVFDRRAQFRLTKRIETAPVTVQIAGAALRPAQADSGFPDLVGGVLFQVNDWKGAHMLGPSQPKHDPLSIGVSGVYRKFAVTPFEDNMGANRASANDATANGYGISIDGLLPVIPVRDPKDKSNGLTLTGSFVTGSGIGDLYTGGLTGGAQFPAQYNGTTFQGTYAGNIDPGLVQYSIPVDPATGMGMLGGPQNASYLGVLRVLNWQTYMVGLQYYLPVLQGRIVVSGNYSHAYSNNMQQQGTNNYNAEYLAGGDPQRTFKSAYYYDANVFIGFTESFKAALSWQHVEQIFMASGLPGSVVMKNSPEHNDRLEISTFFFF
jgi:hypothetical protein